MFGTVTQRAKWIVPSVPSQPGRKLRIASCAMAQSERRSVKRRSQPGFITESAARWFCAA